MAGFRKFKKAEMIRKLGSQKTIKLKYQIHVHTHGHFRCMVLYQYK